MTCGPLPGALPYSRLAGVAATAVLLVAAACGPQYQVVAAGGRRTQLKAGPFLPLHTSGQQIRDAAGRQVILRGLEHHGLQDVDYQGREVLGTDYARIARWGFTTLRVAISWSRIEPEPGVYDPQYVGAIRHVLDLAQDAGLTAILEWHQDLWGRCSQAADSPSRVNANGAPDWTCPADYQPSPLGYFALFDRLWNNTGGLLDAFVNAWGYVIDHVGTHPALLGYDLLNEPAGSAPSPALERDFIFPAYRTLVPRLRARGARGLIFLDAPGLRNETLTMYTEPLDSIGPDLVFAPHLYSGWLTLYALRQRIGPAVKKRDFANAVQQAAALHLPLWNGEWGVNLFLKGAIDDVTTHVDLEDQDRIGSSYWAFERAVKGQGDDSISGGQSLLNNDGSVRTDLLNRLSRPYPIQTPGAITALSFDFATHRMQASFAINPAIQAPLVLYAPTRQLSHHICMQADGAFTYATEPAQQRILVHFASGGVHHLSLAPCL